MLKSRWVFFIPVILGIIVIVLLKQNSSEPQQKPAQETAVIARTLAIPKLTVTPIAIGYGTVQPVSTWEAVAQVEGVITKKHPDLGRGAIIEKDTVLLQIDTTDYELNITQIEADILANRAQLEELETKLENTRSSLEIEKKSLELTHKEFNRLQSLVKKGSVSYSDVETQERIMLTQQQSVQAQNNSLQLIPSQRALLEAQLQQKQSQLSRAHRDLDNTQIIIPFTGRISADNIELAQYVRIGDTLTAADALHKAEIEIQIPIRYFRGLLRADHSKSFNLLDLNLGQLKEKLGISVQVILREGGLNIVWDAHFARLSDTLDPKTRTIGVIVEVDEPYSNVSPGTRPPLIKGFFVEVHLKGAIRPDSLVVPRSALHNNQLYLVNKENRLEIVKVHVDLYQPEYALVSGTLEAGDNIIISDLVPAIQGMLISSQQDTDTGNRLKSLVEGVQ